MKKISELSRQELTNLFNDNKSLRLQVENDFIDIEEHYLSDIMSRADKGLGRWSIGFYHNNYINVSNYRDFLFGLEKMQSDFGILDNDKLVNILKKQDFLDYGMAYENKQYDNLQSWLENQIEGLKNDLLDFINETTSPSYDDILNYFIEFYACEGMDDFRMIGDCIFEIGNTSDYITLDGQSFNKSSIQFNIA